MPFRSSESTAPVSTSSWTSASFHELVGSSLKRSVGYDSSRRRTGSIVAGSPSRSDNTNVTRRGPPHPRQNPDRPRPRPPPSPPRQRRARLPQRQVERRRLERPAAVVDR